MRTRRQNGEVVFAEDGIRCFSRADIMDAAEKALAGPSGKFRVCLHRSPDDDLHEMLVALRRDVRYPPHKNLKSEETHFVLLGEATLCLYDDAGENTGRLALGGPESNRMSYSRIPAGIYHCLEIESEVCVFLETKLGPFSASDNVVAPFQGTCR